ncbi:uncharacterized protein LOC122650804 [Telopea speciosissima]|uniref:uncharacterized protein LOC122650804 n=1 Tax=Telopea speciosissima TaxID=54955 RepID=UPI001CC3EAD9|nr:uncharacterized protein LOC122650804 [Telopea speciosissima]
MTRQIVLPRQPLLADNNSTTNQKTRFAEVAGETTAECAAVCCCFPFGILNLLVLAMYKLPAGLCRKALKKMKKKEKQKLKNGLLMQRPNRYTGGCDQTEAQVHPVSVDLWPLDKSDKDKDDLTVKKVLELEKEMWDRFYGTGFWRSPSQRD